MKRTDDDGRIRQGAGSLLALLLLSTAPFAQAGSGEGPAPAPTPSPAVAATQDPAAQPEPKPRLDIYGFAMVDLGFNFTTINPDYFDAMRVTRLPTFGLTMTWNVSSTATWAL